MAGANARLLRQPVLRAVCRCGIYEYMWLLAFVATRVFAPPDWYTALSSRSAAVLRTCFSDQAATPRSGSSRVALTVAGSGAPGTYGVHYALYLNAWSSRLKSFGWETQVIATLDEQMHARAASLGICAVPFFLERREGNRAVAIDESRNASDAVHRIPPLVGVAKFLLLTQLLRRGFAQYGFTDAPLGSNPGIAPRCLRSRCQGGAYFLPPYAYARAAHTRADSSDAFRCTASRVQCRPH